MLCQKKLTQLNSLALEDKLKVLRGLRLPEEMACWVATRKKVGRPPRTLEEKVSDFLSKIRIEPNGCWVWTGASQEGGYGSVEFLGKIYRVSRIAWKFAFGEMPPKNKIVCHKCDNPPCLNPEHLFLGTQTDNQRDSSAKGRTCRGLKNANGKLSDGEVLEILQSTEMQKIIAKRYNVSRSCICGIKKKRTHKNLWTD